MFFLLFLHLFLNSIVPSSNPLVHTMIRQESIPVRTYLALGDSYTIGESVSAQERFPTQAVQRLNESGFHIEQPDIIAVTGWTTGDLIRAIGNKTFPHHYDIVTLLIGVNNQYQGRSEASYKEEFEILLKRAIQLAGDMSSHVIVVSIPDYSITPFAAGSNQKKIAMEIDRLNAQNKTMAAQYKVPWLDITEESRKAKDDPSLIAGDGLHFSGKEYARWVDLLFPVMRSALQ
jgi:lysophospholipase L1-like esterase